MTIDERLQFLVQSTESLHTSCQELHAQAVVTNASIEKLVAIQQKSEEEIRELAKSQLRGNRRFERFELIMADFGGSFEDRLRKLEDRLFRDEEGNDGDTKGG